EDVHLLHGGVADGRAIDHEPRRRQADDVVARGAYGRQQVPAGAAVDHQAVGGHRAALVETHHEVVVAALPQQLDLLDALEQGILGVEAKPAGPRQGDLVGGGPAQCAQDVHRRPGTAVDLPRDLGAGVDGEGVGRGAAAEVLEVAEVEGPAAA